MRPSNKSRNRNRNNRRVPSGNIVNRVFESAGPDGRVRGTPQQVIEKYSVLAHDAQLSGDRVAAENFMQHSEHYSRILNEAQKEAESKQEPDLTISNGGAKNLKDRVLESSSKLDSNVESTSSEDTKDIETTPDETNANNSSIIQDNKENETKVV